MDRRHFLSTLGVAAAAQIGCATVGQPGITRSRRLARVGLQLYSLRDDARRDLERTLADIAAAGYRDVELLGSFNNFGMAPVRVREILQRNGLRAPSTHVSGTALDDLERQLDDAQTLGHQHLIVASLPIKGTPTLDDYRRWADRLNDAGRRARTRDIWVGFHNHAGDFTLVDGMVPYDLLIERTDPSFVRMQLDTGNLAMAGRDPLDYIRRFGNRYWSFHIKDVPQLGATHDTDLGKGVLDFRRLLASIDNIDRKFLFVEQETYPTGTPLESVTRGYAYLSTLEF
ncbi:MAG: sugar phosphate isomerase/epimerase [Gemmatimonadaceae bacterium]|nr:sugar phosphate isomerase/epimerase [Gemmatimonadaceae bacterium]